MRIKDEIETIDYVHTKGFFERRANKYNENNPYSVTMYQDNNPDLVEKRNTYETERLIRLLQLDGNNTILDLACGIGRWADAIQSNMKSYVGIDFSPELIEIARKRKHDPSVRFIVGSVTELDSLIESDQHFNRVLNIGLFPYLNDADISKLAVTIEKHCDQNALICIREPVGINSRLTLKDFYSSELDDYYNAIYRTRGELVELIAPALIDKGFLIEKEGFLFEDESLNNRKETAQYYFILKRHFAGNAV